MGNQLSTQFLYCILYLQLTDINNKTTPIDLFLKKKIIDKKKIKSIKPVIKKKSHFKL